MAQQINMGRVLAGGALAGVVLNVLDALSGMFLMAEDFRANLTRLGLDPGAMETTQGMATWVIIDFLMGFLVVWVYAAMRPRFGAGPKTAVLAGLVPFLAISFIMYGLSTGGMIGMPLFWKMSAVQLVTILIGTSIGAAVYKEADSPA